MLFDASNLGPAKAERITKKHRNQYPTGLCKTYAKLTIFANFI